MNTSPTNDSPRLDAMPMRLAVAGASPSFWRDAIVGGRSAHGVELALLDGAVVRVSTDADLQPGEPVAFHPVAELLAVGRERVSARVQD